MKHTIKVNFPKTKESYKSGNGEGCYVAIDDKTFKEYQKNHHGSKLYSGILLNDSLEYPRFIKGCKVYFKMCGDNRPVVDFNFLNDDSIEREFFDIVSQEPENN